MENSNQQNKNAKNIADNQESPILHHDTEKRIVTDSSMHSDAFSNPAANTGFGQNNLMNFSQYPMTRLSQDFNTLTSMYRSSWIIQRVCSVLPEDCMTDLWVSASDLSDEEKNDIDFVIKKTKIRKQLIETFKWARLYGGAAAIIMVDGQDEDLSKPLNVRQVQEGSFRGLFVVDRWSGVYPSEELVTNRSNPDFGMSKYYDVRDDVGKSMYRVHHSRVLKFTGTSMPYYEALAEQGWGTSAIEAMFDDIVRHDNVMSNIAALTFKSNLTVYEIENLDQMFASAGSQAQRRMYQMLESMSILESNLGIRLINKGDSIQQLQANFSGLPEVLDAAMLNVAGSTAIPAARLFGREPSGMNSSGEADIKNYRDTLTQQRSEHLLPVLEKLLPIVCMSAIGRIPDDAEFELPNLVEIIPNEKEDIVDKRENIMERLFQLGILPADAVLEAVRQAQMELGMKTSITDEMVENMKGKYQKDVNPNGGDDPFGGVQENSQDIENEESQEGEPTEENNEQNEQNEQGEPVTDSDLFNF